jgi:hypothetical protein
MDHRCRYHHSQPDPRFFFLAVMLAIMAGIILPA